jgi:hypothetical protein
MIGSIEIFAKSGDIGELIPVLYLHNGLIKIPPKAEKLIWREKSISDFAAALARLI